MAQLLLNSTLKGKEGDEVLRSLDAVQVWQEWFAERYGELTGLRHHSNPDDPPDMDLLFEKNQVGLEQTSLKPNPLGHAEAIAKEINPGGGRRVPSVSQKWTRKKLEKLAFPMASNAPWANVADENRVAFAALVSTLKRKMNEPASQVISIRDETSLEKAATERLASDLQRLVNGKEFANFGDRTVILLYRNNHIQFFSALIRRGEQMQAKRDGKPVVPRSSLSFM